ncbi:MAG TPA: RNA polymerase sigma factor [Ktedonobacterales bacterium]
MTLFNRRGLLEAALPAQRARLVRLCAHLTGSLTDADDLAQETLLEAWRSLDKLRDIEGLDAWLSAIARNICLRWIHSRSRHAALVSLSTPEHDATQSPLEDRVTDGTDYFADLDRDDLIMLLERALALLPAETRQALVETYIHEHTSREVATRLGISEGNLRIRLMRGRAALRSTLAGDLHEDALALGLALPKASNVAEWQATRIWCPACGRSTLRYKVERETGEIAFRCTGNCVLPDGGIVQSSISREQSGPASPKSLLSRLLIDLHTHYREGLEQRHIVCPSCAASVPLHMTMPEELADAPCSWSGLHARCKHCGLIDLATLWHLLLDTPETVRFWRAHPRIRALPEREIESDGRIAVVSGYESVTDAARLEFISARDNLALLAIHQT